MFKYIDRLIDRLDGLVSTNNTYLETLEIARASFIAYVGESKKILFTGNTDIDIIERVCQDFCSEKNEFNLVTEFSKTTQMYEFLPKSSFNNNAESILALKECDAVILLEERNKSYLSEIDISLSTIESLQKQVIGFILV